ncbi:translesion error-prone DNA polymerase V autoproteolytic subunit [Shewanella xiamenensis]|uniref:Translesion error-prone DNA polymerase V autoproteolytic subunit n=1 Tax=Shewanella xiamenensis TaxID=332186 RepID=A0AAW6QTS2_9GAMM|nr:translesion error-prone DNA polymerase V autoproteolytic subunit [Shewanella xiamenensis]MDG5899452.1 translesion error-prone DNA polymerase V autoproteolytic subunit [Shewanella xiamenensis]
MRVYPIIPVPAQAGISGFESPAEEYRQLGLDLDELLVLHPSSTFIAMAQGDSMQGEGIFDGDLLIVDRYIKEAHRRVVVAQLNNEFVCKIFDKYRKMLLSSNEQYQAVAIHDYDDFRIEGVVIRSIRMHFKSPLLSKRLCTL